MDQATSQPNQPTHFFKSVARRGKVLAQNSGVCVEQHYPVAYNLGSGTLHWDGWINVDQQYHPGVDLVADIRNLTMVASESVDAVAAIHVLEHFYRWEVPSILQEWRRILKVGGKLIIEVPSLDKVFGYVLGCMKRKEGIAPFMTLHAFYGDPKHKDPGMMHKWGYFVEELVNLIKAAEFRDVCHLAPRYHYAFRDMRIEAIK